MPMTTTAPSPNSTLVARAPSADRNCTSYSGSRSDASSSPPPSAAPLSASALPRAPSRDRHCYCSIQTSVGGQSWTLVVPRKPKTRPALPTTTTTTNNCTPETLELRSKCGRTEAPRADRRSEFVKECSQVRPSGVPSQTLKPKTLRPSNQYTSSSKIIFWRKIWWKKRIFCHKIPCFFIKKIAKKY